jgi:hypothetical protein
MAAPPPNTEKGGILRARIKSAKWDDLEMDFEKQEFRIFGILAFLFMSGLEDENLDVVGLFQRWKREDINSNRQNGHNSVKLH